MKRLRRALHPRHRNLDHDHGEDITGNEAKTLRPPQEAHRPPNRADERTLQRVSDIGTYRSG